MEAIDYLKLLEPRYVSDALGNGVASIQELYGDRSGLSCRFDRTDGQMTQELIWLDDLLLLFSSMFPSLPAEFRQVVSDGDWIHVQFQVRGESEETLESGRRIYLPAQSCVITRYPCGSVIHRRRPAAPGWQVACLYFRPALIGRLLGTSSVLLSEDLDWLLDGTEPEVKSIEVQMGAREVVAINDLFVCSFSGAIRKSYMHAKAMELLTLAISSIVEERPVYQSCPLSDADRQRIGAVKQILADEIENQLTLDQLARRVGVNRSKLAMGFKLIHGTTLQAYWRDMRLERARELLAVTQLSVTDVAAAVGYADISSLTRAFERRFGVLPKTCKVRRSEMIGSDA